MSAFLLATLLAAAMSLPAVAQEVHMFNVATQDPSAAIRTFGAQANIQILASANDLIGKKFNPVSGEKPTDAALVSLLQGTGLEHRYVGERAVALVSYGSISERAGPPVAKTSVSPSSSGGGDLQAGVSTSVSTVEGDKLEEILVTAQKKTERLLDVPVPVTAINAGALVDNDKVRLQDYYNTVPGLNLTMDNRGSPAVSVRGISTGIYNNPTVGVTVDEVPYGASTTAAFSWAATEIDPNELQSVEVLRGPQGALYGASSIGGLIKFMTVDPSLDSLSGYGKAGMNSIHNGSGLGYSLGGGVNVPLSDTIAIRASGFDRHTPGYIDNPVFHLNGTNSADAAGGRLSALWRPASDVSLKLSALYQREVADGSPYSDIPARDLEQDYVSGSGRYVREVQAYSATVKARLGSVDLTSISGYGLSSSDGSFDVSNVFGPFTQMQFGVPGTLVTDDFKTRKFTQELRVVAPFGDHFEWLIGAFYTHEGNEPLGHILAVDAPTGAVVGTWVDLARKTKYQEYAAFSDLTIRLSDQFDVQVGGRESWNRQTYAETDTGPYVEFFQGGVSPSITPEATSRDSSFTYLVTPRFKISPDLMVYARFASGYRPGGANPGAINAPATFEPDKTINYEVGVKGAALGQVLTFDASLYDIEWKDLQIHVAQLGEEFETNGGGARSRGVELSMEARPLKGLSVDAWVAWDRAVLSEDMPSTSTVSGIAGEQLPYSARFSGHLAIEQDIAITSRATGFVGGAVSYVGARKGEFAGTFQEPRQAYAAYAVGDLKAGLKWAPWTINLYANNVTDKRGVLGGGLNSVNPNAFLYVQPRTVGLMLSYVF